MEKHIFKFGAGSWAIVIPKAWVEKNSLEGKGSVDIREDEYGNILLSSEGKAVKRDVELLISSKLAPESVSRMVGMYYRFGVSRLRLIATNGPAKKQFDSVADTVARLCSGFEVIKRSSGEMILEEITDMKEVSLEKIVSRLGSLIFEELKGMGNTDTEEMGKTEELVNRFFMLGIRYLNITQGRDSLRYLKFLQLLETISDQIYEVSKIKATGQTRRIFEQLNTEFGLCLKGQLGDYTSIEAAAEIKEAVLNSVKGARIGALESYLLCEISKNMSKIAELGLNLERPSLI